MQTNKKAPKQKLKGRLKHGSRWKAYIYKATENAETSEKGN